MPKEKTLVRIIILGILLRLIFFVLFSGLSWDSPRYLEQASNLTAGQIGQGYSEFGRFGRFILPPAYPFFIAILSFITKSFLLSARLISFAASIFVIILTFLLGKMLFNERIGRYAAFLVAVYPQFWQDSSQVVIEPFFTFMLMLTLLVFYTAAAKKKAGYFLLAGLLGIAAVLTKPVALVIFLSIGIFCAALHKIKYSQLLSFILPIILFYGLYTLFITHSVKRDLYYYPKSVLAESLYLEGAFPDAFSLNGEATTLKFMDNDYTHQNMILHRPLTYLYLAVQSVTSGINYLFTGNIILVILFYFSFRYLVSPDYFSSWKKNAYSSGYVLIPIISSVVFYSFLLTHKNFMGRMADPVLPLFFIISAVGIRKVQQEFKMFDFKKNGLLMGSFASLLLLFVLSALAINIFYPMVRNIAIYGNGKFILRKEFIAESVKKVDRYKAGAVMTSLADGRSIAYLAGRRIVYFPEEKHFDRIYHYAGSNDVCCIILDKEMVAGFGNPGFRLMDIWKPFENSQYKLYFYTL